MKMSFLIFHFIIIKNRLLYINNKNLSYQKILLNLFFFKIFIFMNIGFVMNKKLNNCNINENVSFFF